MACDLVHKQPYLGMPLLFAPQIDWYLGCVAPEAPNSDSIRMSYCSC